MRYKAIKKIQTSGGISITPHGLFLIKMENEKKEIIQIDVNGNECDIYDFININELYRIHFMNDFFIVSFKNGTTSFYNFNKEKIYELNKQLNFIFVEQDDIYIYIKNKELIYRFNKKQYKIDTFLMIDKNLLLYCQFSNNLIFSLKGKQIFLYKNHPDTIQLVWQLEVTSLFPDQEDVHISEIKEYQGSLIVLTSVATLRLSAEDGSIIWINNGYARTLEIVSNIGYLCTGLCLLKLNLDTGEESGYGWERNRLPDFTYNNKLYWPAGHEIVYHDGLLWYSVCSSGKSFLLAINPDNGNYEWIHHVDTNEQTDAPQFYKDRMFIRDTGNTLHIYEKE